MSFRNMVINPKEEKSTNNLNRVFDALKHLEGKSLLSNVEYIEVDKYGFSRTISFEAFGNKYAIVWYVNCSTLYINENVQVIFDNFEISGTWPNRYKTNLQFHFNDQICCVVPIEKYEVSE